MPGKDSTYETPNPIILSPCLLIPIIGIPIAIGTISILTNNLSDAQRLAFEQGDVLGFLSMMPDSMQGNLGTYMPIIAVIIIATLCVMLLTWSNESQKLNAEGSDLGNVKIKRGKEARRGFKAWNGDELAPKGFACGCDDAGGYYISPWEQAPMAILVGDTGTGKTRRVIIPSVHTALGSGTSVLITDRKGDLAGILEEGITKAGIPFYVIDPNDVSISSTYDPMALTMLYGSENNEEKAVLSAEAIAATILPEDENIKDPHWTMSARGILTAVILYIAFNKDLKTSQKNMPSVLSFLNEALQAEQDGTAERLKSVLKALDPEHPARKAAAQLFTLQGKELGSVLSTLTVALRPFSSKAIYQILAGNEASPKNLLSKQCCVFLRVGDRTNPFNALISLYIAQLGEYAEEITKEGLQRANDVCLLLDEAGNLPPIENLPSMYSTGRSHGLRVLTVWQETAQIKRNYRDEGKDVILGNAALHIPLSPSSEEDKQYYSDMVGKTTRLVEAKSKSSHNATISHSQQVDYVIHPWDWRDRSNNTAIVIRARKGATKEESGVFEIPIQDATKTPAQAFFMLGTEEDDKQQTNDFKLHYKIAHKDPDIFRPAWNDKEKLPEKYRPSITYEVLENNPPIKQEKNSASEVSSAF